MLLEKAIGTLRKATMINIQQWKVLSCLIAQQFYTLIIIMKSIQNFGLNRAKDLEALHTDIRFAFHGLIDLGESEVIGRALHLSWHSSTRST